MSLGAYFPMKVYVYTHDFEEGGKENPKKIHFARIPVIGECIVLSNNPNWYKVVLVLHTPYMAADADAEVWCVKITGSAARKAAGYSAS
ncbi:hypothetical protein QUA54_31545 [Microcoleus sp. MOSTC5]